MITNEQKLIKSFRHNKVEDISRIVLSNFTSNYEKIKDAVHIISAVVGGVGGAAGGAIIGTVVCPGLSTAIEAGVGALATGAETGKTL